MDKIVVYFLSSRFYLEHVGGGELCLCVWCMVRRAVQTYLKKAAAGATVRMVGEETYFRAWAFNGPEGEWRSSHSAW